MSGPQALVGRSAECAVLDEVLDTTAAAQPASLVMVGEPGQGKSALLARTRAAAAETGFTVLAGAGSEFEQRLPYATLHLLLSPVLDLLPALGPDHADALRGALGLHAGSAPPLTTLTATLSLLAAAGERAPVLVVLDDAQWADDESVEALAFAAHRLEHDRVGMIFATRPGARMAGDRFTRLDVGGLAGECGPDLLADLDVAPAVARAVVEMTGGNPLAALEGASRLTAAQRAGMQPLPAALPIGAHLRAALTARVDELPPRTLRALLVAVLAETDDLALLAPTIRRMGGDIDDLLVAERRDIVSLAGNRLQWRHPLMRAAVHEVMATEHHRAAHRALAETDEDAGVDEDVVLGHLAASVIGNDETIAARLEQRAEGHRARGAAGAAARGYELAAQLSADRTRRVHRLLRAAEARWLCGDDDWLLDHLPSLADRHHDLAVAAEAAALVGQVEMWRTGPRSAIDRFELHAARVARDAPAQSALLLTLAASAHLLRIDSDAALDAARRAVAMADLSEDFAASFASRALESIAGALHPDAPPTAPLEVIADTAVMALQGGVPGADLVVQFCAFAAIARDDTDQALTWLDEVLRSGAAAGAVGRTVLAHLIRSEAQWRRGAWHDAYAEVDHAMALQRDTGLSPLIPLAQAQQARTAAGLGLHDRCAADAAAALAASSSTGLHFASAWALAARGLSALGRGDQRMAAEEYAELAELTTGAGAPGWLWWPGDAVEAWVSVGRLADAEVLTRELERHAVVRPDSWVAATARRARAVISGDHDADDGQLDAALRGYASVGAPFDEARTWLIRGRRRLGRGDAEGAAVDLAAARHQFEKLGAQPWAVQAVKAAAALPRGAHSVPPPATMGRAPVAEVLTPAELRVAMVVAHGASNREAADELYLSVKTVDAHLQSVFRKLGVRRRGQLAALLVPQASPASPPSLPKLA